MHSTVTRRGPAYIRDIVRTTTGSARRQGLRSSTDIFTYAVNRTATKLEDRSFSVAGPTARLIPETRVTRSNATSRHTFKPNILMHMPNYPHMFLLLIYINVFMDIAICYRTILVGLSICN